MEATTQNESTTAHSMKLLSQSKIKAERTIELLRMLEGNSPGYIYIGSSPDLSNGGLYKISRKKSSMNCPHEDSFKIIKQIAVPAAVFIEADLLARLDHLKVNGDYYRCRFHKLDLLVSSMAVYYEMRCITAKKIIDDVMTELPSEGFDKIDPSIWTENIEMESDDDDDDFADAIKELETAAGECDEVLQDILRADLPPQASTIRINDQFEGTTVWIRIKDTIETLGLQPPCKIAVGKIHDILRKQVTPQKDYVRSEWSPVIKQVMRYYSVSVIGVRK